jgi:hypothetical protein
MWAKSVIEQILRESDSVDIHQRWSALNDIKHAKPSEKEKLLNLIAGHPAVAYNYAVQLGTRFPQGEPAILTNKAIASKYAKKFFGGVNKWPEANKAARDFMSAQVYAPEVSAPYEVVKVGLEILKPDSDPHNSSGKWTPFHSSIVFKGPLTPKISSFLKRCNWMLVPHHDDYMNDRNFWDYEGPVIEIAPRYQGKGDVDIQQPYGVGHGPGKTFHVTPTINEKLILSKGLSGKYLINQQEWKGYLRTFLFVAKSAASLAEEALTVNEMLWRNLSGVEKDNIIKYGFTLFEVDSSGLELFSDLNMADGYWVHTPNAISPERIRVVSRTGPINAKPVTQKDLMYPKKDLASVF